MQNIKDVDIEEFFCETATESTNTTSGSWKGERSQRILPFLLLLLNKQPLASALLLSMLFSW